MNFNDPFREDLRTSEKVYARLFAEWYAVLYRYAYSVLKDAAAAEEAVQSVFCDVWEKRERLRVHTSLKAYLLGCVYHQCVDAMRERKKARRYLLHLWHTRQDLPAGGDFGVGLKELEKKLDDALNELPDRCRAIFLLSRFGQLGYKEIAAQLDISVKTVEGQMSKALKHLRKRLFDFL
ncbi:MAG TPA: RNA polymerase sigma-70 factor [Puia sp.]|nr:RNA polymerase sigma-70 factor [Puia sp.]